jgi:hypothetical protein
MDLHKPEMTPFFGGSGFALNWHIYYLDISHTVPYLLANENKPLLDIIIT